MRISYNHCKNVLDTLPVGYYLGHAVDVKLDEFGNETYMSPIDESIVISYPMIAGALAPAPDTDDPEPLIRGLLYHEISHCLLTFRKLYEVESDVEKHYHPKNASLWKAMKPHLHDLVNIMEDERIETILARYYMNVDFKKNLYTINNITDPVKEISSAKDPVQKFYFAVRYHVGPAEVIDRIKLCITTFYNLPIEYTSSSCGVWMSYILEVLRIAEVFFDGTDAGAVAPQQQDGGNDTFTDDVADALGNAGWTPDAIKQIFKKRSTNKESLALEDRLNRIIKIATKKHGRTAGATPAYCGRIDPRLCGNNNYKWWLKRSDADTSKRYTKVHFNLFCDNSGSFFSSEDKMNGLLLALKHLEEDNKDFTFDVVHLGNGDTFTTKKDMYLSTNEGSCFENTIFDTYKKLQLPNVTNLNIVVIDGKMTSNGRNGFDAFNHENCIIVTDTDNQQYIARDHKAKTTFLKNYYANTFIDIVMNKIQACLA